MQIVNIFPKCKNGQAIHNFFLIFYLIHRKMISQPSMIFFCVEKGNDKHSAETC